MLLRNTEKAYSEIIAKIEDGLKQKDLEVFKATISDKYGLDKLIKNADVITFMDERGVDKKDVRAVLQTKPVRTSSGVANIAIMWIGDDNYSCPFSCIFCPQGSEEVGKRVPKAYTGTEPTTMRAIRNNYDPHKQVTNRLKQLRLTGHPTDKCELIIMGGTFMAWNKQNRENFIKQSFDAFNTKDSASLEEAKILNEIADNRVIGLTIETRADYCNREYIDEMLRYGATRVEIGVQTTDDDLQKKINRGHSADKNKEAFAALKKAGLKITAHWMPGLTGLDGKVDFEKEVEAFKELFENPDYRPDELKIYPTLVIPGTELYKKWKNGEYEPLDDERMTGLLVEMKKHVPRYVRIKRIMRDISEHSVEAGAKTTNLRQLAKERGVICNCIRCREVGVKKEKPKNISLEIEEYEAAGGKEFFLSYEDVEKNILIGFLRLRIDEEARIREVHVYGQQTPIGEEGASQQHKGYGRKLIEKAEQLAKEHGKGKIIVTSGMGAKKYYEKLSYKKEGFYMVKSI
jgi:elongator complex protein 3